VEALSMVCSDDPSFQHVIAFVINFENDVLAKISMTDFATFWLEVAGGDTITIVAKLGGGNYTITIKSGNKAFIDAFINALLDYASSISRDWICVA